MNPEQIKQEVRDKYKNFCNNYDVNCKNCPLALYGINCKAEFYFTIIAIKELLIDEVIKEIEEKIKTSFYANGLQQAIQIIKDKLLK